MKSNQVYGETQNSQLNSNAQIDLSTILGTWINSNQETEWIRKFTITQEGEQVFIDAYAGSSPENWGKIEVTTYVDNLGQTGFSGQYDLDGVEPLLAANTNKGLCIIATFLKFKNGDRPNFLSREFYYKLD
ncbi:hypothetical protein [Okeania sp. SIO2B3]|uniref:hypothetical protein n=1 Tax=Okeania sp. SIO2B3 TaxID=2607784 RepID=UPI0013C1C38F|nr:hypothetical protein [Okeania sp. SIO2B3]NET44475.1 hypothetical protein [Okeania sp. SIO2B3]